MNIKLKELFESMMSKHTVELFRGIEQEYDPAHDRTKTDAPDGYSTWTDNIELAKQYAGKNGHIYKISLPRQLMGNEIIDQDGERALFFNNEKPAGINNVTGNEYLVYNDHEFFDIHPMNTVIDKIK